MLHTKKGAQPIESTYCFTDNQIYTDNRFLLRKPNKGVKQQAKGNGCTLETNLRKWQRAATANNF